jgi:release factor glutamine methyltransferase
LTAVDISSVACSVTKSNAENLNAASKIEIFENSFMDFKNQQNSVFDIIVSNPPYISLNSKDTLEIDVVGFEPAEALFGGKEGFEILEQWIPKASALLKSEGLFLCEIGYDQGETVRKLAEASGLLKAIEIIKDYSGHSRILKAQKI